MEGRVHHSWERWTLLAISWQSQKRTTVFGQYHKSASLKVGLRVLSSNHVFCPDDSSSFYFSASQKEKRNRFNKVSSGDRQVQRESPCQKGPYLLSHSGRFGHLRLRKTLVHCHKLRPSPPNHHRQRSYGNRLEESCSAQALWYFHWGSLQAQKHQAWTQISGLHCDP